MSTNRQPIDDDALCLIYSSVPTRVVGACAGHIRDSRWHTKRVQYQREIADAARYVFVVGEKCFEPRDSRFFSDQTRNGWI